MTFETLFGVHEQALTVSAKRFELIAANLANVDTPGYRARDLDFRAALSAAKSSPSVTLRQSNAKHLTASQANQQAGDVYYRAATQPTLDGNTVNADLEKVQFMENALRYQFALDRIDGVTKSVLSALRGE
ncbi:MAG TPA: flagellar basal body rod protein FlgB [Gammaproteobacteria bacterium]|nr:flagellar basal body rod protein FlgB [Gammaproteobacteria bacterium]